MVWALPPGYRRAVLSGARPEGRVRPSPISLSVVMVDELTSLQGLDEGHP